jgi:hypothetical protein
VIWAPWVNGTPATPSAVEAVSPTATSIRIRWALDSGGPTVDRWLVQRDGIEVGSVPGTQASYLDKGLAPGTAHRYTVVAVSGSRRSTASAETLVRTLAPSPVALAANGSTTSSVTFHWSHSAKAPVPDKYVIVRNGKTVGTTPGTTTSYTDRRLAPASEYRYQVAALWGNQRSVPPAVFKARTLAPSPVALATDGSRTTSVTFHWSRSPKAPVPDKYVIVRNGKTVGTTPGTTRSYTDRGLAPASEYRYQVAAVWGDQHSAPWDGQRSALSAALKTRTLTPPVSEARLQGSLGVQIKITSSGGGTLAVGDTWTETWDFRPRCTTGPCGAVLVSGWIYGHGFEATLTGAGTEYTGTTTAHITHCGQGEPSYLYQADVVNTLTLRITVTSAGVRSRTWVATRWIGTLVLDSPYTEAPNSITYCPAQSMTASLNASQ